MDWDQSVSNDTLVIVNQIGPDGDSAVDSLEDAALNNGDGNNDGIPDSTKNHVASFSGSSGAHVVIEAAAANTLASQDTYYNYEPTPDSVYPHWYEF